MSNSSTYLKTFKYRLYPTPAQERQMFLVLNVCRNFFNMCVAERKYAYELEGRSVGKAQQEKTAIQYRKTFPQAKSVFSQTMQTVCDDVDKAFQAFFRRVKDPSISPKKKGYPRFKSWQRFHSFAFKQFGTGAKLDGRRLKLYGIGRVAVRWHRPLEGTIKTVRIVHKAGCWYASFACEVETKPELPKTGRVVGIDVGISALLTTSDGVKVDNPKFYRKAQTELRLLQRKLARAKKGSKNRRKALLRVQRQQEHVANQRRDVLHKLSTALVQEYDGIALEDLRVKNMVKNRHLSKSILDSGWGMFRQFLTYKAASAGRVVIAVNPAYTSQTCSNSNCGRMFQNFDLSTRWVNCACGLSLDRDHNAAINILSRAGLDKSVNGNVVPLLVGVNPSRKRKRRSEATRL